MLSKVKAVMLCLSLGLLIDVSRSHAETFQASAPVALVEDVSVGRILMQKNADRPIAPASMTKIMTAYVIFDLLDQGKMRLDQVITVSPSVWKRWHGKQGGATMFLRAGEAVSVENLLNGMLAVSGNDATYALASSIPGGLDAFVALMNEEARSIGLANSYFSSPNGWSDHDTTRTTARDLVILAQKIIERFPQFYVKFYSQKEFLWGKSPTGQLIRQHNKNPLFGRIDHADGLKTGFTTNAGYCFTGSATKNNHRIIMVIAGLPSAQARSEEAIRLMQTALSAIPEKLSSR
ncbi:D-alanyl-D-alanine carboxypeptidase [Acetobacter persici]|uniref:D-alanyl-D-alanine carboxypeptidase family protein n=1 Tax=Acetobacter persici TaxID=1076596 RepID=UPI001BA90D43|nr:D-alanyl-D-alanine carboxypeptidase [Acetobacter persici]